MDASQKRTARHANLPSIQDDQPMEERLHLSHVEDGPDLTPPAFRIASETWVHYVFLGGCEVSRGGEGRCPILPMGDVCSLAWSEINRREERVFEEEEKRSPHHLAPSALTSSDAPAHTTHVVRSQHARGYARRRHTKASNSEHGGSHERCRRVVRGCAPDQRWQSCAHHPPDEGHP